MRQNTPTPKPMTKALRLTPATKSGIESLLSQSYGCVNPLGSSFKTSAKNLREYPTWYLRGMLSSYATTRKQWSSAKSQETMDWAAWELARSMLDESIKNSVGVLLYVDKISNLSSDPVTSLVPSFDMNQIWRWSKSVESNGMFLLAQRVRSLLLAP